MSLIIDLCGRSIKDPDSNLKLTFITDDSFFYLRVISLIAKKMREKQNMGNNHHWVSISEIEDNAWAFNYLKPDKFKSKESMKTRIYQTWRSSLVGVKNRTSLYEIEWPEDKSKAQSKLNYLFEIEVGKGPKRANFRINENASNIQIIPEKKTSKDDDLQCLKFLSLEGMRDDEKIRYFIELLQKLTNPNTYKVKADTSYDAIYSLLARDEIRQVNSNGRLMLSLEDYADLYGDLIGISGVPGRVLMMAWLEQLQEDPWWIELVDPGSGTMTRPRQFLQDKAISLVMAEKCISLGDIVSLLWLFHRAYINSIITKYRDKFIKELEDQPVDIKKSVYIDWGKHFHCHDYKLVAKKPIEAFKDLQLVNLISSSYNK